MHTFFDLENVFTLRERFLGPLQHLLGRFKIFQELRMWRWERIGRNIIHYSAVEHCLLDAMDGRVVRF
jgi:hypothetical protein